MKKKTEKLAARVGVGVITAAAIAGAAAYFVSNTKMAKKGKMKAKQWMTQAQREVMRNVRAARKMSQQDYMRLADMVAKRYGSLQEASAPEILKAAHEMKAEWKNIRRHAEQVAKSAKRSAKKITHKATGKHSPKRKKK